jgi:hypothetical protein
MFWLVGVIFTEFYTTVNPVHNAEPGKTHTYFIFHIHTFTFIKGAPRERDNFHNSTVTNVLQ